MKPVIEEVHQKKSRDPRPDRVHGPVDQRGCSIELAVDNNKERSQGDREDLLTNTCSQISDGVIETVKPRSAQEPLYQDQPQEKRDDSLHRVHGTSVYHRTLFGPYEWDFHRPWK